MFVCDGVCVCVCVCVCTLVGHLLITRQAGGPVGSVIVEVRHMPEVPWVVGNLKCQDPIGN